MKGAKQMSELFMRADAEEAYQKGFLDGIDAGNAARNEKATPITITDEEAETIIAFIKNHEREDIPDDVWEVCMKLMDLTDRL